MNKVVLIGRLTKDPELRYAAGSGTAVTRFTIAVNRQFKKDEADFINCVAWNKTAETIAQYFTKGRPIAIVGHMQTGSYDAQDGTKRYTTDVAVESFEFIGSNGQANNQGSNNTDAFSEFGGFDDVTPADDMGDCPF
ncbi:MULTISPECIES: single-stranded DNA-binding protein [Clostridium]|uniref:single-stranded DNA-binding protein n=1 Tax=Clostridium TaxID=1485 RepID=UPI0006C6B31E|nr:MULTISPECIES: single-stranded DNA-binding protein [Clostridium]MDU1311511.1 single-stranded DNA-binding protein [Clostridium sp.]MDU1408971.1 single-stranded DNA-binding protein [Clostridium sp.]MDU2283735.1 single-stranded DNA-binding protein [Clostridium sp.]CUO84914.1 phage-related single-strand DNA-binding protein [Clostridium paraputrificum]